MNAETEHGILTDHAWRNAHYIHRTDCRLSGTIRSEHNTCDVCHKPWDGHTADQCNGIRCNDPSHAPKGY